MGLRFGEICLARPCFLCDGAAGEHQAYYCPFWRQCVTIKGAKEEDREEILK